jgi:tetratricopeptide (TPR) repeat protein
MNARKGQKALDMLNEIPDNYEFRKNTFYDFLKAKVNMQVGNYGRAVYYAKRYIERTPRANGIKEANLIIFLSHWFMDQDDLAMKYLTKVRKEGVAITSGDKYARDFAKLKELPDKKLSKVRFLSDAGEYEKALAILGQKQLTQYTRQEDKAEYCYRTARIMHHQGKYKSASQWYQKTIEVAGDLPRYFAPKSSLFLGELYDKKLNDRNKAILYYRKVLTYKKTEYKTELEMSAKAALKKLRAE